MKFESMLRQSTLAAGTLLCSSSFLVAQTGQDKVGLVAESIPHATLSLDNTTNGPRRSFVVGQDYSTAGILSFVAGDFNGDGKDTLAVYVARERRFLVSNSNVPGAAMTPAWSTDPSTPLTVLPVVGDWDMDGDDDFGIYDAGSQTWTLELPNSIITFQWSAGTSGQRLVPIAGDWNGDGTDTVGLFERIVTPPDSPPTPPIFYLANANSSTTAWNIVVMDPSPQAGIPCAGNWVPGSTADTVGIVDLNAMTFYLGDTVNVAPTTQVIGLHSVVTFENADELFLQSQLTPGESPLDPPVGVRPVVGNWDVSGSIAPYQGFDWTTGTAASQGFNTQKLEDALANGEPHLHGVLVARNGVLVRERYYNGWRQTLPNNTMSTSKSILSCLYGIAVDQGLLPPNLPATPLTSITPAPHHPNLNSQLSLYHLLTMTAGMRSPTLGPWEEQESSGGKMVQSADWIAHVVDYLGATADVGTLRYSTGLTHFGSYLLAQNTNSDPREFAAINLWGPLGVSPTRWDYEPVTNPTSYAFGGAHIYMLLRDLGRFGQLYLDGGLAGAQQVVSAGWVVDSTTAWENYPGIPGGGSLNYGYWWYRHDFRRTMSPDRYDTMWTWGRGGQHVFVVPELELVVVTLSEWRGPLMTLGMQSVDNRARFRKILESLF